MKIRKPMLLLVAAMGYVGSYAALSMNGYYYPGAYGLQGAKYFIWSPAGFSSLKEYRWNYPAMIFYVPLLMMDRAWIHPVAYGRADPVGNTIETKPNEN